MSQKNIDNPSASSEQQEKVGSTLEKITQVLKRFRKNVTDENAQATPRDILTCTPDNQDPSRVLFLTYDWDITVNAEAALAVLRGVSDGATQPDIIEALKVVPGVLARDRNEGSKKE